MMKANMENGGKKYTCADCGKSLSKTSYYDHKKKHKLAKARRQKDGNNDDDFKPKIMFACSFCSEMFDGKNPLQAHVLTRHINVSEKFYVCNTCQKSFSTSSQLSKHRLCHTGKKPFTCTVCGLGFTKKSNLGRHELTHGSQKYKCPVCKIGYASEINLKHHQRKHESALHSRIMKESKFSKSKNLGIEKCSNDTGSVNQSSEATMLEPPLISSDKLSSSTRVYKGVMDLQMGLKHLKLGVTSNEDDVGDVNIQTTPSNTITVVQEAEIIAFPFSSNIEKHSVTVVVTHEKIIIDLHPSPPVKVGEHLSSIKKETSDIGQFNEPDSNSKFPEEYIPTSTTQTNMDSETGNENFEEQSTEDKTASVSDNECSFDSPNHMVDHESYVESKKSNKIGRVKKDINCEKIIRRDVVKHIKDGEVFFACNRCDITCPDLASMKIHVKSQAHRTFTCHLCDKVYSTRALLTRHLRTHTGERPYQCEICGKKFICANGLHIHRISHSTERPHHCAVCGKGFSNTGALHEHERIHTGEKRHQCETCGKSFTHRSTLKRHVIMHSGQKPFQCKDCPRAFPMHFLLKQHMTTHTGEKAFKCYKCAKAFTSSSHLSRHKKVHCKAVYFSFPNTVNRTKEEAGNSLYESYIDSEQAAVSTFVVDVESAVSNISISERECTVSSPLIEENNVDDPSAESYYVTTNEVESPSQVIYTTDAGVSVGEIVVAGPTETVDCLDNSDSIYQCTGCLNTFTELESARNHICLSDILESSS